MAGPLYLALTFLIRSLAPAPPLKLYDIGQVEHIAEEEDEEEDDGDDMGMARHRYYASKKILGKLYRNVDESNIWHQDIRRSVQNVRSEDKTLWMDIFDTGIVQSLMAPTGPFSCNYKRQLPEAWKIRNRYEGAIEDAMWQFSDNPRKHITEVEVFCGFILNKRGSQTRRQRDSSIKLKEATDNIMDYTVKQIREAGPRRAEEHTGDAGEEQVDGPDELSNEDVLELCLACLVVGCWREPTREAAYSGTGQLQSFKLVAASCLVKELTIQGLLSPMNNGEVVGSGGGGFVGVNGGQQATVTLPIR